MTYYELKKVFSKKGSKIALTLIFIIIGVVMYFIISDNTFVNENGITEKGVNAIGKMREEKKKWAGPLTEEKIRQVIEENIKIEETPESQSQDIQQNNIAYGWKQGIQDIRGLLIYAYGGFNDYNYYLPDSLSPDVAADFYPNRIKTLKDWLDKDGKEHFSEKEKEYVISTYKSFRTPLVYDYQSGWKSLFQYAPSITMIMTLILSFLCAGIFSSEIQQKSSAVFFSSYYGRNRAVLAKIKAGMLIISTVYWGAMLLYTCLVLGILGTDGANCSIQSYMTGWKSIYNITNLQEYILIVLGGYLGCLFMMFLTMLVSAKTNSAVLAVTVPFVLIFLPSFLSGTGIPMLEKIMGILPDQLLQMNMVVKTFNLYEFSGMVFKAAPILLCVYLILTLLIMPVVYLTYRKKQVY